MTNIGLRDHEKDLAVEKVIEVLVSAGLSINEAVQVLEKVKEELQHARLVKNGDINSALL